MSLSINAELSKGLESYGQFLAGRLAGQYVT